MLYISLQLYMLAVLIDHYMHACMVAVCVHMIVNNYMHAYIEFQKELTATVT